MIQDFKKKKSGPYISIPEYARYLGISRIAVYKKVKAGLIPAEKIGRNYVILSEIKTLGSRPPEEIKEKVISAHISIPQLARQLGISRIAVYKKVRSGQIKAQKAGRNFVISTTEAKPTPRPKPEEIIYKPKEMMSVPQLGKALGISRIAAYHRVKRQHVQAARVGRNFAVAAEENQYVSIPQLAKQLGLSRIAVYKKVKKGEIKGIKVGRNFVVPKKEFMNVKKKKKNGKKARRPTE